MKTSIRFATMILLGGALAVAQQNTTNSGTTKSPNAQTRQSAGCSNQTADTNTNNQSSEVQRSNAALRVIADTNQARSAISQRNQANAKSCIADALDAINSMPSGTAGQKANGASANVVPIYTELSQVSVLGPVHKRQEEKRSGNMASKSQTGQLRWGRAG